MPRFPTAGSVIAAMLVAACHKGPLSLDEPTPRLYRRHRPLPVVAKNAERFDLDGRDVTPKDSGLDVAALDAGPHKLCAHGAGGAEVCASFFLDALASPPPQIADVQVAKSARLLAWPEGKFVKLASLDGGAPRSFGPVRAWALSSRGHLAWSGADGALHLLGPFDAQSAVLAQDANGLAFSKDGALLAAATGKAVTLRDVDRGTTTTLDASGEVAGLRFSDAGNALLYVVGAFDGALWSAAPPAFKPVALGKRVALWKGGVLLADNAPVALVLDRTVELGTAKASVLADEVRLAKLAEGKSVPLGKGEERLAAIAPDGRHVAFVTLDGSLALAADDARGALVDRGAQQVAFSRDGTHLAWLAGGEARVGPSDGGERVTAAVNAHALAWSGDDLSVLVGWDSASQSGTLLAGPPGALVLVGKSVFDWLPARIGGRMLVVQRPAGTLSVAEKGVLHKLDDGVTDIAGAFTFDDDDQHALYLRGVPGELRRARLSPPGRGVLLAARSAGYLSCGGGDYAIIAEQNGRAALVLVHAAD